MILEIQRRFIMQEEKQVAQILHSIKTAVKKKIGKSMKKHLSRHFEIAGGGEIGRLPLSLGDWREAERVIRMDLDLIM